MDGNNNTLLLFAYLLLIRIPGVYTGDCHGPQMKLLSDDARRTCTEISASSDKIEYKCASLIRDLPKAMIKYCPIEICQENGTWSKPSISCALSECYVRGHSKLYVGHRTCTASGRPCQRWNSQTPHRHRFQSSSMFPDHTIALAESFCRDPEGNKGAPWCFTSHLDKKWEFCDVIECSEISRSDGFCGTTSTDAENEYDDTFLPGIGEDETCSNSFKYPIHVDYRIKSKVIEERTTRSMIECTSLCSKMTSCKGFTFRKEDMTCTLHGGKETMFVKSRGYKSAVKSCSM